MEESTDKFRKEKEEWGWLIVGRTLMDGWKERRRNQADEIIYLTDCRMNFDQRQQTGDLTD